MMQLANEYSIFARMYKIKSHEKYTSELTFRKPFLKLSKPNQLWFERLNALVSH